jgi:hypothetical protein
MDFIQELILLESNLSSMKELAHVNQIINKLYGEWKKIKRRTNAVDMTTKSANKLAQLNPETAKRLHDATKLKLVVILMRCMDIPPWKPLDSKERIYKKLLPMLTAFQNVDPNTGTGGKLKEVVLTRFSAAMATQDGEEEKVFVAYEPRLPSDYIRYLFGDIKPVKTYRMMALEFPPDFESLINILSINYEKARSKFKDESSVETQP